MRFLRLPVKDPRTVARDIPGVSETLFPQLLPGLVAYLNRGAEQSYLIKPVPKSLSNLITIKAAMLFEIAYVKTELILKKEVVTEQRCIELATVRQLKFFDAEQPRELENSDWEVINLTSSNLLKLLSNLALGRNIQVSPSIPGFQWISNSTGDFSIGNTLIEVKCTARNFSASDYRQILMYWLLSYASAIEKDTEEWNKGILLNPRLNKSISFEFDELIRLVTGGRSKVETLELFNSIISEYGTKLSTDFNYFYKER